MGSQERRYRVQKDSLELSGMLDEKQRFILRHLIGLAATGREGVDADGFEKRLRLAGNAVAGTREKVENGLEMAKHFGPRFLGRMLKKVSVPQFSGFPQKLPLEFSLDCPLKIFVERTRVYNPGGLVPETLHVEKDGVRYSVRVGQNSRHLAESDPVGQSVPARVIVSVIGEPVNEPLLEKGVCWIESGKSGNPARAVFNLENIEKHLKEGEISSLLRSVSERVEEELQDIFRRSKKRRVLRVT